MRTSRDENEVDKGLSVVITYTSYFFVISMRVELISFVSVKKVFSC